MNGDNTINFKRFILPIVLGAMVYLALAIYGDFSDISSLLLSFPISALLMILALTLVNYCFRFLKWHYFTRKLNIVLDLKMSAIIFYSGLVMSISPGKLGEVLKSLLLKAHNNTPITRSAPIVLVERLTDFLALMILSVSGVVYYKIGGEVLIILAGLILIFLALIAYRPLVLKLIEVSTGLPLVGRFTDRVAELYESTRDLVGFRSLIFSTGLSVLSWWMECYGFFLTFQAVGIESISIQKATFVYAFSTIVGAISMLPGGLGITEASMTAMLATDAAPAAAAAASTIIIRACTLWFSVALGAGVLALNRKKFDGK